MAMRAIPVMWSGNLRETLDFYIALGYVVTYEMHKPYTYASVERDGYELNFGPTPKLEDGKNAEDAYVGCLVMVDDVAALHAEFKKAIKAHCGRVPANGFPRITRFKPGQTRFTVVDPVGNGVLYIQNEEPDPEYGGSKKLGGLSKVLDNARIFTDFKNDDSAAKKIIETGLRRFRATASPDELTRAADMLAVIERAAGKP
ncbi:glyoxalase [Nocardia colli]|uniref:Glyoxalase n=1 Tax=Nocardia colli TaxID=2545717 RepID=A0A5N0E287_9NOCA|nr:glyoxalase [Nocardia colli]KAA8881861.1 glyoxalase [Nocardia colli]